MKAICEAILTEEPFVPSDLQKAAIRWAHGLASKAGNATPGSFWWHHKAANAWILFHNKKAGLKVKVMEEVAR